MPAFLHDIARALTARAGASAGVRLLSLSFVAIVASGCGPKVALEPIVVAPEVEPSEITWIREDSPQFLAVTSSNAASPRSTFSLPRFFRVRFLR